MSFSPTDVSHVSRNFKHSLLKIERIEMYSDHQLIVTCSPVLFQIYQVKNPFPVRKWPAWQADSQYMGMAVCILLTVVMVSNLIHSRKCPCLYVTETKL
jgi:hypothetical protein